MKSQSKKCNKPSKPLLGEKAESLLIKTREAFQRKREDSLSSLQIFDLLLKMKRGGLFLETDKQDEILVFNMEFNKIREIIGED